MSEDEQTVDDEVIVEPEAEEEEVMVIDQKPIFDTAETLENNNVFFFHIPDTILDTLIEDLESTPEKREKAIEDLDIVGSRIRMLAAMYRDQDGEAENSHTRISNVVTEDNKLARVLRDENNKIVLGHVKVASKVTSGSKLSGQNAVQMFKGASNKNFGKRIPLYNSGFWIELESPTNAQISQFVNQIIPELDNLGRQLGAIYYTYMDYHVKDQAGRLIKELTKDASFKNWNYQDNLLKAISIEDYDVILLHIASMMYPEGFDKFRHPCINPDGSCDHVTEETIDLTRLIYNNYSLLNKEAVSFLQNSMRNQVNILDLDTYKSYITFGDDNEIRWKNYGFILKTPTYHDYKTYGLRYINLIQNVLYPNEDDNQDAVRANIVQAIAFRMLRQLAPWIKELRNYTDDEDYISTEDESAIEELLDHFQTIDENDEVYEALSSAINKHKVSHICYPVFSCPKCGHAPDIESGFLTINPMRYFFTMCLDHLQR